jgi:glycosyltransferase involved in cell wall biosynthesis
MARIAIFHLTHWDQLMGGAELQLSYLVSRHLRQGDEVHVIYIDRNGKPVKGGGESLHAISQLRVPGVFGKTWFLHALKLTSILKSIDPDLIVTRTRSSLAGVCAKYAKKHGKKHRHYVANDNELDGPAAARSLLKIFDRVEWRIFSHVFSGNSELICQNDYQRERLMREYGINARKQTQMAPVPSVTSFDKPDDSLNVVWVANLKQTKRPDLLVELVERLASRRDIRFTMIGADQSNHFDALLDRAKTLDGFRYLGGIPNENVNEILSGAHVLVNTSEHEGFSNVFVQAWLREVVVVSMNSNPDEVLTKENIGFISNTVEGVADVLRQLADDRRTLKDMAARSRDYSLKHHTLDGVDG